MRAIDQKRTLEMLRQIEENRRRAGAMTPEERIANEHGYLGATRRMYLWIAYGNAVVGLLLAFALILLHVRWQTATWLGSTYFVVVSLVLFLSRRSSADRRAYFLGAQGAFAPHRPPDAS